ncbi:MAG: hypothetical protein M3448_01650 [Pseudomonadota bacterium]|nr:hypothetical protein [Pseudomonadota bacterium]
MMLLTAAVAACGRPGPVSQGAENASDLPEINQVSASPSGGRPPDAVASTSANVAANRIPAGLQGRWGLTPADCMSDVGGVEGLLVIDGDELRFYESVAIPAPNVLTSAESISGDFEFRGEGQNWTKYQNLRVRDGKLTRTERAPMAGFRYVRCD